MFTEEVVQKLKQSNISVDAAKTKQRATAAWKSAGTVDKDRILSLSGAALSTVQRAYRSGSISAKLAVPFALTLDIDPFYLTGEADERGVCTEALLLEFLKKHKYNALVAKLSGGTRKRVRRAKGTDTEAVSVPVETADESDVRDILDGMTVEDMVVLLKSVMFRARLGGKNAELAEEIKRLLLS